MARYTKILIDVDNTLLDFDKAEEEAFFLTCRHFGLENEAALLARYHVINDGYWKLYEKRQVAKDLFPILRFRDTFSEAGYTAVDPEAANAFYMERLCEGHFLMPGAEKFCAELSKIAPYYLITNGTAFIQHSRLKGTPVLQYACGLFISDEVGFPKPSPEFFREVFKTVPCGPEMLIVGDSLTSDILGGVQMGVDTCLVSPDSKALPEDSAIRPTYQAGTLQDVLSLIQGH